MAVTPTTRSTFASTIWNSPAKAQHTTNAAKFGGPNINISEGSKVQFGEGSLVWDVVRVFEDGTLYLMAVSSGVKRTRRVPPTSPSWTNLWMVDGKSVRLGESTPKPQKARGGGPKRTLDPGNVILLGNTKVRWTVESVLRDGTVKLYTSNGDKLVYTTVGPTSKFWNSMYTVAA